MTEDDGTAVAPLETDTADGVFEGGGVKGIAFVGALEAARDHGIERWINVAGTSAGAIVASLLAVGYQPQELRRILEATDDNEFADYGWGGEFVGGARNALRSRGVSPGRAFTTWLGERFAESPLAKADPTFADVERQLPAGLNDDEREKARFRLRVIASDITEGRMLVLPDDIVDYTDAEGRPYVNEELPIVSAVRMSMSFPYFYDPVKLFFSATEAWDRKSSKASRVRTISIPTGAVPTLKFGLTGTERDGLRAGGFDAAERFFTSQRQYLNHSGLQAAGPAATLPPLSGAAATQPSGDLDR